MPENGNSIFVPDESDIAAATEMLLLIRDGGVFHMPLTKLLYRVDHKARTLTLVGMSALHHQFSQIVHQRVIRVFAAVGYKVIDTS